MLLRMKAFSIALAFLILIPASMVYAEKSLIFYILDSSGSMWGRADGKIKIQAAKEVMTTLLKETPYEVEYGIPVAHFRMGFEPQLIPAGKYRVIYRKSEHASNNSCLGNVIIKEGEMTDFAVNKGVKLIPQQGMEPPYRIEFIELNEKGEKTESVFLRESFDPMPLKPGKYKITYRQKQHESSTITIVESFDLPPGNLVEVEL